MDASTSPSNRHGLLLIAVLLSGYMVSRGIAKAGTSDPYSYNNINRSPSEGAPSE